MLLELHNLELSLRASGITLGLTERRIQPYPKQPALEIRLDQTGEITELRQLTPETLQVIRKFECSTGGARESIPGFNIEPLCRRAPIGDRQSFDVWLKGWKRCWKSAATKPGEQLELLRERGRTGEANWDFSPSSKINLCLQKAAKALLGELDGADVDVLLGLRELLRRSALLDAKRLHTSLLERLFAEAAAQRLDMDLCRRLLYSDKPPSSDKGAGSKTKGPKEGTSLILELDNVADFGGCPVNHQTVWTALSQHLLKTRKSPEPDAQHGRIAASPKSATTRTLFGEDLPTKVGPMPERALPKVGKVKLFSLSGQIPCQARYGLIESAACPVGPDIQDRLIAALEWVTRDERQGQTWDDVTGACGFRQPALLIAYPNQMPISGLRLSSLAIRRRSSVEAIAESRFETEAEALVSTLKGICADNPRLTISIIVIAKADKARKKILYSRQFTVQRLIEAAVEWQEGARNIPPIFRRTFGKDGKPRWERPSTPYPDEVVCSINTCWNSNGEDPRAVSNVQIGLGLALLMETGPALREATREALRPLVRNVVPLVLALARANSQGRVLKGGSRADIPSLVPSILGLILAKAGHLKGEYMNSNAYLIGRLLSLADEFHRFYCDHERGGKRPPQLIGNSLMPTALENPAMGLARLAERLPLYQKVASAKLRDEAGAIERAIDKAALRSHSQCSDADKAQMLLGYLARPDLETSVTTATNDISVEETDS
jgi:hypothetical protein